MELSSENNLAWESEDWNSKIHILKTKIPYPLLIYIDLCQEVCLHYI